MQTVTSNTVYKAISYSTNEVDIGAKWIDGSSIYRQVIEFSPYLYLNGNDTWNDTGVAVGSRNRVITCKGINATGTLFDIVGCALDISPNIHLLNYRPSSIQITKLIIEYTKSS